MDFSLKEKTAIVVGGSKGLGFGMATGLAQAGANAVSYTHLFRRWRYGDLLLLLLGKGKRICTVCKIRLQVYQQTIWHGLSTGVYHSAEMCIRDRYKSVSDPGCDLYQQGGRRDAGPC